VEVIIPWPPPGSAFLGELIIPWAPLESAFFGNLLFLVLLRGVPSLENLSFSGLLQGVPYLGTHHSFTSFKEHLPQELIVPWPLSGSFPCYEFIIPFRPCSKLCITLKNNHYIVSILFIEHLYATCPICMCVGKC